MSYANAKSIIEAMLEPTDIKINGSDPWDIHINNKEFYKRVLTDNTLGFGEAYMDGWWDCEKLDVLVHKILSAQIVDKLNIPLRAKFKILLSKIINFQSKSRAKEVAKKHYDIGNDLFKAMLDPRRIYSCAYYKEATTLEEAQNAKLDLICKKLKLRKGMRLLDIGCGWGGLAKYAAEKYEVGVVGITISTQQFEYAKQYCQGYPIEIRLQDYRDLNETFDSIVSVGMFEHVGSLNYKNYMQIVGRTLSNDGLFLLHTIGANYESRSANEWMVKYIFPNGMLPSEVQITKATQHTFIVEDWQNFGSYYDHTLLAWYHNFLKNWDTLKNHYDERFKRMWIFYLLSCAGSFRARSNQLWQVVLSKNGVPGGYLAPR